MSEIKDYFVILDDIVQKYIKEYFTIRAGNIEEDQEKEVIQGVKINELVREISEKKTVPQIYAIDGSSRSFISSAGIISISTLAISSSYTPIYGVYPSLFGLPSLPINKPFIGIASSNPSKGKLDPYLYSSKYLTSMSLAGEPFLSTLEPERIETEIRAILETEALKIVKDKGKVLIDGPLFPSYIYLPEKVKEIIRKERTKIIDKQFVSIVKRLDKSNLLVRNVENPKEFESKFKVNPRNFLSDEAFLYQLVRFNFNPPYPTVAIGPFIKDLGSTRYYINYLVIPYHKYVPKFSILRVESVDKEAVELVASLPFTFDGIPKVLSIADKTAKELSNGILKYIIYSIKRIGLQESFRSKFEVYSVV